MSTYRVVTEGWLVSGTYIPPGTVLRKTLVNELPNLELLVAEGVLEVVPEESAPRVPKKSTVEVSTDGADDKGSA